MNKKSQSLEMKLMLLIFILQDLLTLTFCDKKVVCYYGSWSVDRPDKGHFTIEHIDPHLCTHLIYSVVGITAGGDIRVIDEWNDLPKGNDGFGAFNALKDENPELKTLVSIGGASEGSITFSHVMDNEETRTNFVKNAVEFVQNHTFDGLDIDWEYPGRLGGIAEDKVCKEAENFVRLLKELRAAFDEHDLLLSAAVAAAEFAVDISYNVPEISKYLDMINVMAHDFHGPWENRTGQNAPLFPVDDPFLDDDGVPQDSQDAALEQQLCVDSAVQHWLEAGAPPEKLILGIAMYGRSYTLADQNEVGLGAPTIGRGKSGPYTAEPGMMGYNEICEKQMKGDWVFVWDRDQQVPHTYNMDQWIGYDNTMSVKIKARKAMEWNLGGVMAWSIDTDDFLGHCHKGKKFPLLNAISEIVNRGSTTERNNKLISRFADSPLTINGVFSFFKSMFS